MKESSREKLRKAVLETFGFDLKHLTFSHSLWNFALWNQDDYPELAQNDSNILNKLDKIFNEIINTDRNTTSLPIQIENQINGKSFKSKQNITNILVNGGMNEMGKRSTNESSSTNIGHAIGTGDNTPELTDIILQTEIFRKSIGTRTTVLQTERYGTAFTGSDIGGGPAEITEAGIFTTTSPGPSGIMIARVTSSAFLLETGKIFTLQTNITHKNGIQI